MRILAVILVLGLAHANEAFTGNPLTPIVNLLKKLEGKISADQETSVKDHKNYACWAWHSMKDASVELCTGDATKTDCEEGSLVFQRKDFMKKYQAALAKKTANDNNVKKCEREISKANKAREDEQKRYQKKTEDYNNNVARLERQKASLTNAQKIMCGAQDISNADCKKESMKDDPCCKDRTALLQTGKAFMAAPVPRAERAFFADLMDEDEKSAFLQSGYTPASGKVQGMIDTMLSQSIADLEAAHTKYDQTTKSHDAYQEKQRDLIKAETKEMNEAAKTAAEAGEDASEAQSNYQNADATFQKTLTFFDRVNAAWKVKRKEFVAAREMREDELKAVREGLNVLDSDDNRALMDKSDKGTSFLQMSMTPKEQTIQKLMSLITKRTGGFSVEQVMDEAVADLKTYKKELMEKRDDCVKRRHESNMEIKEATHNQEKAESAHDYADSRKEKFAGEKAEAEEQKSKAESELDAATEERNQENKDFQARKNTDEKAVDLLKRGREKIAAFYERPGLIQDPRFALRKNEDVKVNKGEKGSHKNAGNAVLMLIDQVIENTRADMAEDEATEASEAAEFTQLEAALNSTIDQMDGRIAELGEAIAGEENKMAKEDGTATTEEKAKNDGIAALKEMNEKKGGCDFVVNNFDYRQKRADSEIKGLRDAKATIQRAVHQEK